MDSFLTKAPFMEKAVRWPILLALPLMAFMLITPAAFASNGLNLLSTDSTETDSLPARPEPLKLKLKPTIGLGTGMFTFYGDIGTNHNSYHPTVSRIGYDLSVSNPLTDYLDLSFYALFGQLGANERGLTRNLNFESKITTGGMRLSYNFDHILKEDRIVSPYISAGIESFEFLSKTDRYDANGNEYFYWSDGSIRNMDENDPNAEQSIEIYRDYTYETDIRETNLDGIEKYSERSWAFPIGVGATFHMSEKFDFKVGTNMHFSLTDNVDGVTGESVGSRIGTAGKDKFLFTSFSLHYNLQLGDAQGLADIDGPLSKEDSLLIKQYDLDDSDGDGVGDFFDECPDTPLDVAVDDKGCPIDDDKDGIANYLDEEPNSPEGAEVDENGVAYDDQYWTDRYNRFVDSTGAYAEYNEVRSEMVGGEYDPGRINQNRRKYTINVGGESKNIDQSMIDYILSLEDVETEVDENGNVIYKIGDWEQIEPALLAQIEMQNQGIETQVSGTENGENLTAEQIAEATNNADPEIVNNGGTDTGNPPEVSDSKTIFRVQIGAFSQQVSEDVFNDVPKLIMTQNQGLTKYLTGSFTDFQSAAEHKVDMVLKGYDGAFIVAYKDGERVSLESQGATIVRDENLNDAEQPMPINKELVKFRVQVGAFANEVPTEMLDLFIRLGNVEAKRGNDVTKYVIGPYDSYEEAQGAMTKFKGDGAPDAFVIGEFNGNLISSEEAIKLLNQ